MARRPMTPRQRAMFWRSLAAACAELGHDTVGAREAYRRTVMREECGKEHLGDLDSTTDFDAVMRRFARDAGDFETASRFAIADEGRKAALVRICCAQVLQLKGVPAGTVEAADYLAGIVEQARIPCGRNIHDSSFWMDVNPEHLITLFQMLDTHRRHLLRGLVDGRTARAFLGFDPAVEYQPIPGGGVRIGYYADTYSSMQQVLINIRHVA